MPFANANSAATGLASASTEFLAASQLGGKVRAALADFTLASDAVGTYTAPIRLPRGARVLALYLNTTVTLGTTTVAVGVPGAVGRYRAAATFTAADAPTFVALAAATNVPLATEEQIIITTAVAALPASGRLIIGFLYVDNS
jgi:hypothetical protein